MVENGYLQPREKIIPKSQLQNFITLLLIVTNSDIL